MNRLKILSIICVIALMMVIGPSLGTIPPAFAKIPKPLSLDFEVTAIPGGATPPVAITAEDKRADSYGVSIASVSVGDIFTITPVFGKSNLESETNIIFTQAGILSSISVGTLEIVVDGLSPTSKIFFCIC